MNCAFYNLLDEYKKFASNKLFIVPELYLLTEQVVYKSGHGCVFGTQAYD